MHYVELATKQSWFTSSTREQQYYFHLLSTVEKTFDEFNTSLSTGGSFLSLNAFADGHLDATNFAEHRHEIETYLQDQLQKSYGNDTKVQYPIELIAAMRECHKDCQLGTQLTCSVVATSDREVVFSLGFHPSTDVRPKFAGDITLPTGVKTNDNKGRLILDGQPVKIGTTFYQLNRSADPNPFTLLFKTDSAGQCYKTAPPIGKSVVENAPSQYSHFCKIPLAFSQQSMGYTQQGKCSNMPPGGTFIAVFNGHVMVDNEVQAPPPPQCPFNSPRSSWVTASLGSPLVTTPPVGQGSDGSEAFCRRELDKDDGNMFVLTISGTIPSKSDDQAKAGDVPVELTLQHCQTAGSLVTCSTRGESTLTIMAIDP